MQTKNDTSKPENKLKEETGEGCSGATCYALFAFGHYYPNGGIDDLRGTYATIDECRQAFVALGPTLMSEQGYCKKTPGVHDCTAQIVELPTLRIVETIQAYTVGRGSGI